MSTEYIPGSRARRRVVLEAATNRRRVVAAALDALPILGLSALCWWQGLGGVRALQPHDWAFLPEHLADTYNATPSAFLQPLVIPVVIGLVWCALWQTALGDTPGKRLLGLTTVDARGAAPGPLNLALRLAGYVLSASSLGLGWLVAFISPSRRALHDLVSDTWVVRRGRGSIL